MVNIFTFSFNNPKYLEFQSKLLKKYCKNNFQFFCIDNSIDNKISNDLKMTCNTNGIRYEKNMKPDHSLPGTSHYAAIQYAYHSFMEKSNDVCVLMDHDMFPIDYINFEELVSNNHIAGFQQSKEHIYYLHPALIVMDMKKLPNKSTISFNGAKIDEINVDIGGELYKYFESNKDVKINKLHWTGITNTNQIIPEKYKNIYDNDAPFELINNNMLHTRLGSNWIHFAKNIFDLRNEMIYFILNSKL